MPCARKVGCHNCIIEQLEEDMRLFRAAIIQFIAEGDREKMRFEGHSIIKRIDEFYEPRTEE